MLLTLCLLAPAARVLADPIVLRVGGAGGFRLPDKNATDPKSRADRAIVEAFERSHPNVRLESAQGLQIAGPAAESNLLLEFAGGTAPDVIYVNFRSSASYIDQGFLMPLDGLLRQHPDVQARINPAILKVLRDAGSGHIYSIPFLSAVQALYYRKDLFQEAGLDPNRPPGNWDEFYEDARKLTDQDKGRWGFEFGSDPDASAYWWINFLWQAGGEVVQRNAQGQWAAAFNTPAGVTALEFYKKLLKDPWKGPGGKTYIGVATHSSTMGQDRALGKVGMWFQYQSNIIANQADATQINPSLVGIAPMPKGPTGITANEANAYMWGISSQIKDPLVRDAAWRFITFMASDEADRIRTQAYVEAGLGNTVNPVALAKYGYADYSTPAARAWLETNRVLFRHGHPEPYGKNMSQIYVLLGHPLDAIEHNPGADPKALLDQAAREVNATLTGYVPPAVQQRRRREAWTVFGLLLSALLGALGWQARRLWERRECRRASHVYATRPAGMTGRSHVFAWLFMVPAVLSIALWAYYPLARGLVMAFQNYRILGGATYIGLDNFIEAFHQHSFWMGLRNSFLYTFYNLTLGFFLPILIALGLSEIPRGRILFRTLYYLPAVTSSLIITYLWKWFEDGTPHGLFNTLLGAVTAHRAPTIDWLGDPSWAMLAVLLPVIWAAAGPGSIIYLAALKSIPDEMYEAADLDGAGVWTKIRHVTLPTLKPLILINLIGATIAAFQASQNILVQTGGGPLYATHTLGLEIWYNAFLYLKFGYATAAAWIMGALLVGFTLLQLRMMRDLRFSSASA
ncbi:MAG: extracellular solute-binding protein [Armatimonadetes bacterium]|nr:extracellular solute-binding protein [Armatimonadota bacterium]